MTSDEWRELSAIFRDYQASMLNGWKDEDKVRSMLLTWLRDHDMPCPLVENSPDFYSKPGAESQPGCRGLMISGLYEIEFEFDAESGDIVYCSIPFHYLGRSAFSPTLTGFLVKIKAEQEFGGECQVSFSVKPSIESSHIPQVSTGFHGYNNNLTLTALDDPTTGDEKDE